MTGSIAQIDVDSEEYEDAPKGLRDAYKKLQKEYGKAVEERDSFRNQVNTRALGDLLADKKFKNPSKVQRDLLADEIDPLDQGAVDKWLADNADDYARETTESAEPVNEPPSPGQEKFEQMAGVVTSPAEALDNFKAAQAELPDNPTPEQVRAAMVKHGV